MQVLMTGSEPSRRLASVRDLARPSRYRAARRPPGAVAVIAVERPDAFRTVRLAVVAALARSGLKVATEHRHHALVLRFEARVVRVMDDFVPCAVDAVRSPDPAPGAGMRVRLAIGSGSVEQAVRMCDASGVRAMFDDTPGGIVVVVSDDVYDTVVRHGYAGTNPSTYRPVVLDGAARAWVHVPGCSQPRVAPGAWHAVDPAPFVAAGRPSIGMIINGPVYGNVYGRDHVDGRGR